MSSDDLDRAIEDLMAVADTWEPANDNDLMDNLRLDNQGIDDLIDFLRVPDELLHPDDHGGLPVPATLSTVANRLYPTWNWDMPYITLSRATSEAVNWMRDGF